MLSCSSRRRPNPLLLAALVAGGAAVTAAATLAAVRALRATPIAPGSVVLVTGGSRGLGFSIASRFAHQPVKLVLVSRNRADLEEAETKLLELYPHLRPEDFYLIAADLANADECRRVVSETIARYGRIDVLVNNAGIITVGPVEAQTVENFEQTMRVNFFAAFHVTWAALPHMRSQQPLAGTRRAAIVNIASVGGKLAVPHMLPYSAAKFALVGFSEGLNAELYGTGVQVTTVCPGLMRTGGEAHAHFLGNIEAEKRWFNFAAKTPGLATTPEHAANRVYQAVEQGRGEIIITPQAWMGARIAGFAPNTVQFANALANRYVLPRG
ncbi:MAG TPA: SDR family NAD(P)-dependent oxidoreductase [Acidobacteriaceae bacterium]|jgi:short-subunit dehydrogenase